MAATSNQALTWCLMQSIIFVGSLYSLVPANIRALPRNDPLHIRYRAQALIVATITCFVGTYLMEHPGQTLEKTMLSGLSFSTTLVPLVSYFALFSGPVAQLSIMPDSSSVSLSSDRWVNLRNLIIAPLTEELVFRGFMASVTLPFYSEEFVVFVVPLFFGLAHVHHAYLSIRSGDMDVKTALIGVAFQTAYTTFFGALMMRCLIKTRNILAPVLIHSWCNFMGFPQARALVDPEFDLPNRLLVGMFYIIGIVVFMLGLVPQVSKDMFRTKVTI